MPGLFVILSLGAVGVLFLLHSTSKPDRPELGQEMKISDATGKSVTLKLSQVGPGVGFIPVGPAKFDPDSHFFAFGRNWDFFEGLNAFVERAK